MIVIFGSNGSLGENIRDNLLLKNKKLLLVANSGYKNLKKIFHDQPNVVVKECNVLNHDSIKNIFIFLLENKIKIDALINNFAYTYDENEKKIESNHNNVKKIFEVNYIGLAIILEELVKYIKEIKHNPIRVVNVLSNSLKTLNASNNHYIASKAATEILSRHYAKNFSKLFSINNVAPGLMKSNITKNRFYEQSQKIIDLTPLGRLSTIKETSELICYFATESPLSICGQTIYVDGGRTL